MDFDLPVRVIVATRRTREAFFAETATGRSLLLYMDSVDILQVRVHAENTRGLPAVYNQEVELARDDPALLVFVHDDVHFCDFWWWSQVRMGLLNYRLIGVIGNRVRRPGQGTWLATEDMCEENYRNFSGFLGMGTGFPPRKIVFGGLACVEVKLLDGVFLACLSETLIDNDIRFDEQFDFHFYDIDMCRQFEFRSLSMGTWNISLVHESEQKLGAPDWVTAFESYIQKWGE